MGAVAAEGLAWGCRPRWRLRAAATHPPCIPGPRGRIPAGAFLAPKVRCNGAAVPVPHARFPSQFVPAALRHAEAPSDSPQLVQRRTDRPEVKGFSGLIHVWLGLVCRGG